MKQIVIVGAGFGGLRVAKSLRRVPARLTLIDRSNHHLFQPLLYQVATAGLSPADIAAPIRSVLRGARNTEVVLGKVTRVDVQERRVYFETLGAGSRSVPYDDLVLATGARHSYFGHEEWEKFAPGLKSIPDATTIRRNILLAFEAAEIEPSPERRRELLTFVLVGGGPTGVEMAGSIAELAHVALARDFRHIDPREARILLLEAGPRVLSSFPESLSAKAQRALERLGVEVRTSARVTAVDENGVSVQHEARPIPSERIPSRTVIWAAGVVASPVGKWLGAETDRAGRVRVSPDLTVPGHPEIFVIGDAALALDGNGQPLPGVAPVAMQQGRYVASVIRARLEGNRPVPPFRYVDKGNLATIGRSSAVADFGWLRISGFLAWLTWLLVHIFYLIGFRNRILVMIQWAWAYFTFQRGARLITQETSCKERTTG